MSTRPLSVDPLWPRAGDWPPLDPLTASRVDVAVLGIPTWQTSLSQTGAGETPAAVRSALRYYSTFVPGLEAGRTQFADAGDVADPDGPEGEARAIAAMADAVAAATVTVAIGGDNALTVPAALGAWGDE